MDRADLLAYLATVHADLLIETGIPNTDSAPGLLYPLDQTFARIGDDTPGDLAFMAVGEFYSLQQMWSVAAARVDFDATAHQSGKYAVVFAQIEKLLESAAERAEAAGYPTTGESASDDTYTMQTMYLDFSEPMP